MDVVFLMGISGLSPGLKLSVENNSVRENFFLSECFCRDSILLLREIDQNIIFGGKIGYDDSHLEFYFRNFEVIKLHAILFVAAGAVRAHSGKGPGYCYLIARGSNSCLFGQVTRLLLSLYVKLFEPSLFNSFDFRSGMSCIVLDIELTHINVISEMGVFIDGNVQGNSFCPPKK